MIIKDKGMFMEGKKRKGTGKGLLAVGMAVLLAGCGSAQSDESAVETDRQLITIGFSQLGSESDWRVANTEHMKTIFSIENGYDLLLDDAQQKQEKQITAIRNYIQQEVDYIVVAPVMETGWDTVLQEAKEAGIPVVVVDRMVKVEDDSLYTAWVGSDFEQEGKKACAWLSSYIEEQQIAPADVHIIGIQGTLGASAQIGRSDALTEAVAENGWDLITMEEGDYTQAKSHEVMQRLIGEHPETNVVYCENDNEAFGAIEALEEAGYTVGRDLKNGEVMILSFDSTHMGLQYVRDGKIALDTECNPLQADKVEDIIQKLQNNQSVEKQTYVEEQLFCTDLTIPSVQVGDRTYDVTEVTDALLEERQY